MRDVLDPIREPGSANAGAVTAAEVVVSVNGVEPRRWRVVDQADAPPEPGTIVPVARWLALAAEGADLAQVGASVEPDTDLAPLAAHLEVLPVIAIHYPRFGDGRGYSHARRLRYLWGYRGELLAYGDVLRDQLVWMWRVGIDRFHLRADQDPVASRRAFTLYSAYYQY